MYIKINVFSAISSNIPNAVFVILNVVYGQRFRLNVRLLGSLTVMATLFIAVLIMTRMDSDSWQSTFLLATLLIVVLLNICTAIFQGGLIGVAGKFPANYMGGMMAGQALGGIFLATVNIPVIALQVQRFISSDSALRKYMHVILFPGQPKQPRVLLLPDRLPVRAAEPDHVHGDPDHGLLQTPRGHRGSGLQERRDHLRGVRGRVQGDAAENGAVNFLDMGGSV